MKNSKTIIKNNWKYTPLLSICDKIRGVSYKKSEVQNHASSNYLPILRANNISNDGLNFNDLVYAPQRRISKAQKLIIGDVVVAMSSGSKKVVGKTAQLKEDWEGSFGAFCGVLRPSKKVVNPYYFGYFFNSPNYRSYISKISTGTNINNLKNEHFENIEFPLPPPPTQEKIVQELDDFLPKVGISKNKIVNSSLLIENFRQAILHAAVTGKLTEDLREKYRVSKWKKVKFKEICDFIGGSQPPKTDFIYKPKKGYLRLIQIRDYKSNNYLTFIPTDKARRICTKDDVMIGRYGPPLFQILRGIDGAYNVALMKAVPRDFNLLDREYLYYYLKNPTLQNYIIYSSERTVGQDGVRKNLLEEYEVSLPNKNEQIEIARRVTLYLKLANDVELSIKKAEKQVEKLTQSILAKAFRGELIN